MGDASRPRECPRPPNVNQTNLDCTHDNQINHDILRKLSSIIVLSFDHRACFLMNILGKRSDLPFLRKSDHKKENPWFLLRMSRMLAGKHKPNTVGRLCAWADHFLEAVICRSSDRLSTNKKKEKLVRIIIDFHVGLNISLSIIAVLSTVGPRCIAEGLLFSSADKNCYFDPWRFVTFSLGLFYTQSMLSVLFWIINLANMGTAWTISHLSLALFYVACPFLYPQSLKSR